MYCMTNAGGGGSGSSAWAYIGVTYPAGSVCTATNGSTTLNAQGTSGLYVFLIPQPSSTPETWTVSCTDGTRNKSATVSISQQYQFEVVALVYGRLPVGYQEVEYLQSSGTQYFNLGLYNNLANTEITLDFMLLAYAQAKAVLGADNTSGNIVYIGRPDGNSSPYNMSYWYSTKRSGTATLNERVEAVVNDDNGNILENNTIVGTATISSSLNTRLYLFGVASNSLVNARVYALSMRNKTTNSSILNYVPCYRTSDNQAGFYDLTNSVFVTGTGTFIVGADV